MTAAVHQGHVKP